MRKVRLSVSLLVCISMMALFQSPGFHSYANAQGYSMGMGGSMGMGYMSMSGMGMSMSMEMGLMGTLHLDTGGSGGGMPPFSQPMLIASQLGYNTGRLGSAAGLNLGSGLALYNINFSPYADWNTYFLVNRVGNFQSTAQPYNLYKNYVNQPSTVVQLPQYPNYPQTNFFPNWPIDMYNPQLLQVKMYPFTGQDVWNMQW